MVGWDRFRSPFNSRELTGPLPDAGASRRRCAGELWALLIAGSAGWGNYRHQADVAHAYQVLRRGGLPEDRIVTMMANDVAHDPQNPHPGKLFNRPGGPNVFEGVRLDYTGADVNAANFLAVLRGEEAPAGVGRHTGRVIASGPNDRVFVYYRWVRGQGRGSGG